jgi:hypothetical protein
MKEAPTNAHPKPLPELPPLVAEKRKPVIDCPQRIDTVEEVFSGDDRTFFSAAGTSRARQREGPHRSTQKRSQTCMPQRLGESKTDFARFSELLNFRLFIGQQLSFRHLLLAPIADIPNYR